jgi:hypothetical protein
MSQHEHDTGADPTLQTLEGLVPPSAAGAPCETRCSDPGCPAPDTPGVVDAADYAELMDIYEAREQEILQLQRDKADLTLKLERTGIELTKETYRTDRPPTRRRLPDERRGITHCFKIFATRDEQPHTYKAYLSLGFYEDGSLGEIFFKIDRAGSEVSGLCDGWAVCVSVMLQYGIPFEVIAAKHRGAKFEPSGFTSNKDTALRTCSSPLDYAVRFVEAFLRRKIEASILQGVYLPSVDADPEAMAKLVK